jgi:hypothetical protein
MITFIENQCGQIARAKRFNNGHSAGKFFWLLVRLGLRQDGMKALLFGSDPFLR